MSFWPFCNGLLRNCYLQYKDVIKFDGKNWHNKQTNKYIYDYLLDKIPRLVWNFYKQTNKVFQDTNIISLFNINKVDNQP